MLVERTWEKIPDTPSWSAALPYRDLPSIHALICDLGRKTTEGQLWTNGIDLLLTDSREREDEKEPLPESRCKIELVGLADDNASAACQLTITLDDPEAAAWLPSIKEWIGEHFNNLDWVSNHAALAQVQEEVLKSRGGETIKPDQLTEKIGTDPVAVWFVAHPPGEKKVTFNEELGRVKYRMSALGSIARIEPTANATIESLKDSSRRHKPRIIHFIGHGTKGDTLIFQEANGPGRVEVKADKFSRYIKTILGHAPLEVVVLNACFSSEFAKEVSLQGVYVIGTEDSLKNEVACTFSGEFYGHYYRPGSTVEEAFSAGIEHVYEEHNQTVEDYHLYFNGEEITLSIHG